MMKRVTAPGLPSSPKIFFDEKAQQAKISLRHSTWHGIEHALQATELLVWIARIGLAAYLWNRFGYVDLLGRLILVFLIVVVAIPLPAMLLRIALRGFIARQVFPARTTLWVTPEAIAFQSRLYSRPVVVWRQWNDQPVGIRFILDRDYSAERYSSGLDYKRKLPKEHLNESAMLYAVVTTTDLTRATSGGQQDASMRTLPITEIGSDAATRATMAFAHALTITASRPTEDAPKPTHGIDIDAV